MELPTPEERFAALRAWLSQLPPSEMPAFLSNFIAYLQEQQHHNLEGEMFSAMAAFEVISAEMIRRQPDMVLRDLLEPGDALARPGPDLDDVLPVLLRQWAARDFTSALAFFTSELRSHDKESLRRSSALALVREYVRRDPESALNWALSFPEDREMVTAAALQTLSHSQPELAASFVLGREDMPQRERFLQNMAEGWARSEPEKALQWALALPEDLSRGALTSSLDALAGGKPEVLLTRLPNLPPHARSSALALISSHAAELGFARTAELLTRESSSTETVAAAATLAREWTRSDPHAASGWIAELPGGRPREAATIALVRTIAESDPQGALQWAGTLSAPEERHRQSEHVFREWQQRDPAAAAAWLQSAPVPPALRQELERPPGSSR